MADGSIGEELLGLGWRAGSVVPVELYDAFRSYLYHTDESPPQQIGADDWLVVVSQSCDIVARNNDAEPYVDVLWSRPHAGKPRTQYCDLRSTRRLDFRPNRDVFPATVLTAHASADKFAVPRSVLLRGRPDGSRNLTAVAIKRLHAWLALRSNRPAWPESFATRVAPAVDKLKKALQPLGEEVAEVRVAISPNDQELDTEPYSIVVYFVVAAEQFESPEIRRLVSEGFSKFVTALKNCNGLSLNTELSEILSGDVFTWEQTQRTDRWDFAYLTPLE